MVTITPADKSFKLHAWGFAAIIAVVFYIYPSPTPSLPLRILQIVCTGIVPVILVFIIAYRNVTFERGVALRYTMPPSEFRKMIKFRPMLDADKITSYLWQMFNLNISIASAESLAKTTPRFTPFIYILGLACIAIMLVHTILIVSSMRDGHEAARKPKTTTLG